MIEKDAEEYNKYVDMRNAYYRKRNEKNKTISYFTGFDDGAEFGYNKCFEQIRKLVNEDTRLDCIIPELLRLKEIEK